MNERIRALALQVGAGTPQSLYGRTDYIVMTEFELEKFAESIINECIEQVWYTREDVINGNISEVIKERIRQQFGVKEFMKLIAVANTILCGLRTTVIPMVTLGL